MRSLRKRHLVILAFLSCIISLIFVIPHIIIPKLLQGSQYEPLSFQWFSGVPFEEAHIYAAKARESLLSGFFIREIATNSYQQNPSPFIGESLPSTIMAVLAKISGSISNAFILADFIFPPLIFLLIWYFSFTLTNDFYFSLLPGVISLTANEFIAYIPYPSMLTFLSGGSEYQQFLFFSRNFHPEVTFIFFMLTIIFLHKSYCGHKKLDILLAGVLLGLLFYTYIFYWTITSVSLLLLIIYSVVKNKKFTIIKLGSILLIGVIVGSFYLFDWFQFSNSALGKAFILKYSFSYIPFNFATIRYILIVLFLLILTKKRGLVLCSAIVSGFLLTNFSQYLLGRNLESFHWIRRAVMPLSTLGLVFILFTVSSKFRQRLIRLLITVTLLIFLARGAVVQYQASILHISDFRMDKDRQQLLNFLNSNTKPKTSIATINFEESLVIPVYTNNKSYIPKATNTLMLPNEALQRFLYTASLDKIPADLIDYLFTSIPEQRPNEYNESFNRLNRSGIWYIFYLSKYSKQRGFRLDGGKRQSIFSEYKKMMDKQLKIPLDMDYLLITPIEKKYMQTSLDDRNDLRKIFQNSTYTLYKKI